MKLPEEGIPLDEFRATTLNRLESSVKEGYVLVKKSLAESLAPKIFYSTTGFLRLMNKKLPLHKKDGTMRTVSPRIDQALDDLVQNPELIMQFTVPVHANIRAEELQNSEEEYNAFLKDRGLMPGKRAPRAQFISIGLGESASYKPATIERWLNPSGKDRLIPLQAKQIMDNLRLSKDARFGKIRYVNKSMRTVNLIRKVISEYGINSPNALCTAISEARGIPSTRVRAQIKKCKKIDERIVKELLWIKENGVDPKYCKVDPKEGKAVFERIKKAIGLEANTEVYRYLAKEWGVTPKSVETRLFMKFMRADFYNKLLRVEMKINRNKADNVDRKLQNLIDEVSGGERIDLYSVRRKLEDGKNEHVDSRGVNYLLINLTKLLHDRVKQEDGEIPYIDDFMGVLHKVSYDGYNPSMPLDMLLDVIGNQMRRDGSVGFSKLKKVGSYIKTYSNKVSSEVAGKYGRLAALRETYVQKQKLKREALQKI